MKTREKKKSLPPRLKSLQERIEHWRETRDKQGPMPQVLWQEATELARVYGVYRVSSAAGLAYDKLKRLVLSESPEAMEPSFRPSSQHREEEPQFVELSAAAFFGAFQTGEAVLELELPGGYKLRLRLPTNQGLESNRQLAAAKGGQK